MATSNFGKAFKAAREAGDKEFEFGGKKYNTKMKDDSAPAKKADTGDLEAKGQAGNKAMQDEEEKSSRGPDSASKNLGSAVGSRKVQPDFTPGKVPSSAQAVANIEEAGDKVKSVASGVGDYLSKTFSMEGREQSKKEGKERYGMKKGGSVSSASSRGDGIAQRGKTRGKMC